MLGGETLKIKPVFHMLSISAYMHTSKWCTTLDRVPRNRTSHPTVCGFI